MVELSFRKGHTRIDPAEPAPAPAASQHPADLKPRGVKAPLHMIPWGASPIFDLVPGELFSAAQEAGEWPDGDEFHDPDEGQVSCVNPFREPEWLSALAANLIDDLGWAQIAEVFAYGARKYARDNWRTFTWDQAAEDAYFGAIFRHLDADRRGETIDPESGLPHRAHAACGALISIWHYRYSVAGREEARPDV